MSSQVRRIRVDALVEDMDVGSVLALGESTEQALGVLGLILPGEGRVVEGARGLANNDHRGADGELLEAAQHDVESEVSGQHETSLKTARERTQPALRTRNVVLMSAKLWRIERARDFMMPVWQGVGELSLELADPRRLRRVALFDPP